MRGNCFITILIILLVSLSFQAQTNKRTKITSKKISVAKPKTKKKKVFKVISLGVVNGKAINLVKPEFPLAAKAVNVRGSVNVSILIDEKGIVIEAEAFSGHPLLWANSVSAALKSTFEPITIGGNPVRVRGIIVYKYSSDTFNWLEIGNALGDTIFTEMLPSDFEEEKQMYEQYLTADYENGLLIYQNLRAMIENKLIDNKKNLWLFQVGVFLKKFQANHPNDKDWKNDVTELKNLVVNSPENISQALISKLKNLQNLSENPHENEIYRKIQDIKDKMPVLGN